MRLELARSAGFCYGVRRAVQMAEMAAEEGRPCVMLGPIIHNRDVIAYLESIGVGPGGHPRRRFRLGRRCLSVPTGRDGPSMRRWRAWAGRSSTPPAPMCPAYTRSSPALRRGAAGAHHRHPHPSGGGRHRRMVPAAGGAGGGGGAVELAGNRAGTAGHTSHYGLTNHLHPFYLGFLRRKSKKRVYKLKILDTICNATCKRQSEAQALAARSDAMVVIGGRESSNTKRLAELCGALCPMVVWIERAASWNLPTCVGRLLLESLRARPRLSGL